MGFAANFTAIDFETASRRSDSACQLAAVVVRDGQIVDEHMWMIRPEPFYFSRSNIRIHGITPERVENEPNFGELWSSQMAPVLDDDCLVAHNASFDIGVLIACLRAHRKAIPDLQFTCTRAIARRTWPHHRRYGLKPLAQWLGIRFRHHDALEDSIACAKILLAAGIDREATSMPDLEKRLRLRRGSAGNWGYQGPSGRIRKPHASKSAGKHSTPSLPFLFPNKADAVCETADDGLDLQRLLVRAEFIRPLSGKQIVISGRLRRCSAEEAEMLAQRSGGNLQSEIDHDTDLIVIGGDGKTDRGQADRLMGQSSTARIVAEEEFFGLIVSADA
ncbi:MAG: exonuclease domain-containing protein [Planctomycetota bacterium]